VAERFHLHTLGCPKNVVDSEKLAGALRADGLVEVPEPADADLVLVNTCAFVEAARVESVETILAAAASRRPGARLVVTGCLAERCGPELAAALPEIDLVVGFAGAAELAPVVLRGRAPTGVRDLLELPRPAPRRPWAYLKVAEGCDRACAFCAIPSFRGPQRSRRPEAVVDEATTLVDGGVRELVLVAQDLAAYGRDAGAVGGLVDLLGRLERLADRGLRRVRLLYLYPSEVRGALLEAMVSSPLVVPYFDLSLQHVAVGLLRRMRRWGSGERFLALVEGIRRQVPDAAFRSSFIVGFPGETEDDHTELGAWLQAAELDWAGFFAFSREDGTAAAGLDGQVPAELAMERLRELAAIQDPITAAARDRLLGSRVEVLVDRVAGSAAVGRTHREAPEIDGEVHLDGQPVAAGAIVEATVTGACGPDLRARPEVPVPTA
jgi:ribosomal protein S12 methylthiotransferase